jgi:hypothetical protein
MKSLLPFGSLIVACLLLSACASKTSIEYVNAELFLERAKRMNHAFSAEDAIFIGTTPNRAYLEYTTCITFFTKSPATIVCWVELDKLPPEVAEKIKAGQPPWVPFDYQKWEEKKLKQTQINLDGDIFEEGLAEPIK